MHGHKKNLVFVVNCLPLNNDIVHQDMISFITETTSACCAVRTECLNRIQFNFSLQRLGSMKYGQLLD